MQVPLFNLSGGRQPSREEVMAALESVISRHRFVMGEEVAALEEKVARLLGAGHAVGVSSGTDALLMALMALGVGPGDEVVTSPFTFFATAGAIARLGARPVFADIEPRSFNLDPARAEAAAGPRTRALVPVHLYGRCADLAALRGVAARRGLALVEDAAQAIGARTPAGAAGAVGEAGCLSFYPTKNLGAFGDAGMVLTSDPRLAARLVRLRVHGSPDGSPYEEVGGNFRMDTFQAAVLLARLPFLEEWNRERREAARRYDALFREAGLGEGVLQLPEVPGEGHVFHQYVVRTPRREELGAFLRERGIGSGVYYRLPLHLQPCFRELGYREGDFPESEKAGREVLSLPMHPGLGRAAQERVVGQVRAFFDSAGSGDIGGG